MYLKITQSLAATKIKIKQTVRGFSITPTDVCVHFRKNV